MKRRDFLINSAAIFGGCTLFSGCKDKLIKKEGQVVRRKFKDITLPLLGLGCMRLPMKNEKEVDMVELDKMVEYSINHGVNYFDTAYMYVNYKSENAIGEILKKYPRESYFLADKSPTMFISRKEQIRNIFYDQLRKCSVDYFDFYLVHNINKNDYDSYKKTNMHNELLELKKEGKIKYLGFSFHGTLDMLKEVTDEGNWDFCQLQLNYLDWDIMEAKEQHKIAAQAKLPIIAMEPLRGGLLVNDLADKISGELKKTYPQTTPAELAFRWTASLDNVVTVLSGMSNLEQVKENVKTFENFELMTKDEKKFAQKTIESIVSATKINCTGCNYCAPVCPKGIDISKLLSLYSKYKAIKDVVMFVETYRTISEQGNPETCTKCGLCSKHCPQNLNIPELLAEINDEYKKIIKPA